MIKWILIGLFISVGLALMKTILNNNVGDCDVKFNYIYNPKKLKRIKHDSRESGKCNSPFIENESTKEKIDGGGKIIADDNALIYKKEIDYDCKPKW